MSTTPTAAEDRDFLARFVAQTGGWVSVRDIRRVCGVVGNRKGSARVKADLRLLVDRGRLERRVDNENAPWQHRHVFYRALGEGDDAR